MKKNKINHEAQMPMLEIIIVTGLFTIISVFLLKLFVSADSLEKEAKELSQAVLCAENVAEEIKASGNLSDAMEILGFTDSQKGYRGRMEEFTVTVGQKADSGTDGGELDAAGQPGLVKEACITVKNEKDKEVYELSVAWNEDIGL